MIWLYRLLWIILGPIIDLIFLRRILTGKEEWARIGERLGKPSLPRPAGRLVWLHCASVGESISVLPLIEQLLAADKKLNILLTTGTRTSAQLMVKRLAEINNLHRHPRAGEDPVATKTQERHPELVSGSPRAFHQYIPLDFGIAVKGFLDYWQPERSVFVESEFWPELLRQAPNPILISARVTEKSFNKYRKWRGLFPLHRLTAAHAQSKQDAERLIALGTTNVTTTGSLKFDAAPLPIDKSKLTTLKKATTGRKILVAASTHAGEETQIAQMHQNLVKMGVKNLLTVIIPRHPHRGERIFKEIKENSNELSVNLQSNQTKLNKNCDVLIADSMGEMGLWFSIANAVIMGGSLIPHGGQNPVEPLKFGAPTLCGPHMENFKPVMQILLKHDLINQENNLDSLTKKVHNILNNKKAQKAQILAKIKQISGATKQALKLINS